MRTARSVTRAPATAPPHRISWIVASLVAANVAACSALDFGPDPSGSGGGSTSTNSGGAAAGGSIDFDAGGGSGGGAGYAALCGRGTCDPSERLAVSSCENGGEGGSGGGAPGATGGASSGSGGVSGGAGGASSDNGGASSGSGGASGGAGGASSGSGGASGGAGGASSGSGGASGGAGGMSSGSGGASGGAGGVSSGSGGASSGVGGASSGSGGAGPGSGGNGGGTEDALIECKVILAGSVAARGCVTSGTSPVLSPCTKASDCGPGLGCVLVSGQGTGVCREYCCGDLEACPQHTYCAPRPMADAGDENVPIPVCVDADDCTLLEEGQCAEGLMCAVVRADGTTACVEAGSGKQGDTCPCASGFACAKLVNECRQICHTEVQSTGGECPVGFECQGNASMPDGFGLCVSTGG